jgi:L-arabinose isomerase
MDITFKDFNNNSPKYDKAYFMVNAPKYIEFGEYWKPAVNIATDNGKKDNTFAAVIGIYNKLIKKMPEETVEEENTKYKYYKKRFDLVPWTSQKEKEFYKSILTQLKEKNKLSERQWQALKKRFN